ncbi:MAG TPA: glucosamine-6-phosphate deaminase [Clostridiaceae bacterium]|nr:glucosamine-6-phosphate deaminase [Clostridiaceae bacterium]
MRIMIVADEQEMSIKTAMIIADIVRRKPDAVLGLPTGSTPLGTYRELARMYREENLDFSRVHTINLDEYVGLSKYHPQSYRSYMRKQLFDHINIDGHNTHIPDGMAEDVEAECRRFDEVMFRYGYTDLQLIGIGPNGHIAFNEPADSFTPDTHVSVLTESTINANQRFFRNPDDMPRTAISLGMRGIMSTRHLVLIACGDGKAEAIAKSCFGPVTPWVPGSIIQLHPFATVIADEAALALCPSELLYEYDE